MPEYVRAIKVSLTVEAANARDDGAVVEGGNSNAAPGAGGAHMDFKALRLRSQLAMGGASFTSNGPRNGPSSFIVIDSRPASRTDNCRQMSARGAAPVAESQVPLSPEHCSLPASYPRHSRPHTAGWQARPVSTAGKRNSLRHKNWLYHYFVREPMDSTGSRQEDRRLAQLRLEREEAMSLWQQIVR